jgi:hypothetical protein
MSFTTTNTMSFANVQQGLHSMYQLAGDETLFSLDGGKSSSQHRGIDHQAQRKRLLSSLRGKTICVPDLAPLFQHWPTKTNPDLARMNADVHDWLNK